MPKKFEHQLKKMTSPIFFYFYVCFATYLYSRPTKNYYWKGFIFFNLVSRSSCYKRYNTGFRNKTCSKNFCNFYRTCWASSKYKLGNFLKKPKDLVRSCKTHRKLWFIIQRIGRVQKTYSRSKSKNARFRSKDYNDWRF